MKIKKLHTEICRHPIHMFPGDSIRLDWTDEQGVKRTVAETLVSESYIVNRAVVFEFTDGFGAKRGIGGAFLEDGPDGYTP